MRTVFKGQVLNTDHRYTIRPMGGTAWATAATLPAARVLAREATDRGLHRVVIVDEESGEVVR
jgi:hypothetical protein